jgi:ADP-heptose:LPS heptosyltransferase
MSDSKNLQRNRLTRQSYQPHPRERLMASLKKTPLPQHLPKQPFPNVETARSILDKVELVQENIVLTPVDREVTVLVPQGVGDIFWVYQKLSPYFDRINLEIATIEHNIVQIRSKDWVKLFPKVGRVTFPIVSGDHYDKIVLMRPKVADLLRDHANGRRHFDFACNNFLETGTRLEDIDPELPPEWNVNIKTEDVDLPFDKYIILYVSGSNKTTLHWTDRQWIDFTLDFYKKYNLKYPLVMIGASYDAATVHEMSEVFRKNGIEVKNYVDLTPGKVCHIIKNSLYFIGYQSGLSIITDNFDIPQFMLYFPRLKDMLYTWAKKENIQSGIFRAVTFNTPYEKVLETLPDTFPHPIKRLRFLVPQGIGDSVWAMFKIQDIAEKLGGGRIEVRIACFNADSKLESRAVEFISRFKFIDNVCMYQVPYLGQLGASLMPGNATDENGLFRYLADGTIMLTSMPDIDYVLMPNAPLERGVRLEKWLPEFATNWNVMDDFEIYDKELEVAAKIDKPYVVFYCSSIEGNSISGHNRNAIWKPEDWVKLGNRIRSTFGLDIVVVGAEYDKSYYETKILPLLDDQPWINMIGECSICETLAITKKAKFVIAYQSGIGIVSSYLGTPVAIFWREHGDSISPHYHVSFEEEMASAWVKPDMITSGKHLPLIYGRHDEKYIVDQIVERKWI